MWVFKRPVEHLPQTHRLGMHLPSLHWKLSGVQLWCGSSEEFAERMSAVFEKGAKDN